MYLEYIPHEFGIALSALIPMVRHQKEHPAWKKLSDEVLKCLSVWVKVQMICI